MIYRAIQLIQIFLADGRTGELTKVIQEVLADLKTKCSINFLAEDNVVMCFCDADWPRALADRDGQYSEYTQIGTR